MTNATRTLLYIFLGMLVLTGMVTWMGGGTASEALRGNPVQISTEQVNRLVIASPLDDRTVILRREEGEWSVTDEAGEDSFEADSAAVAEAVGQLSELSVVSVATRDTAKFTRYRVDSTGTRVELYRDNERLAGFYLGSSGDGTAGSRYLRNDGEQTVYAVEGFAASYDRTVDDWRERTVWELDREAISRIDFIYPADSSYSIERAESGDWISSGDTLLSAPVSGVISGLASLEAEGFVDSLTVDDFGEERYAVQVRMEEGSQRTLRLRLPSEEATEFHSAAGGYPYLFTLNRNTFLREVLRARPELVGE